MSLFSSKPKPDPLAFLADYDDTQILQALSAWESVIANVKIAYNGQKELFDKLFAALTSRPGVHIWRN